MSWFDLFDNPEHIPCVVRSIAAFKKILARGPRKIDKRLAASASDFGRRRGLLYAQAVAMAAMYGDHEMGKALLEDCQKGPDGEFAVRYARQLLDPLATANWILPNHEKTFPGWMAEFLANEALRLDANA